MRDIKFQGKRVDNGEWVYGDLHHGPITGNIYIMGTQVIPETVGQYTGLSDKDILTRHKWPEEKPKWTDWYLVECVSGGTWHEVVYWKDGCFFIDQRCLRKAFNDAIAHWWDLPEATE